MRKDDRPLILSDLPVLRLFFRRSIWRDASVKWFLSIILTPFFVRRLILSTRDIVLNEYFGRLMGRYSKQKSQFSFIYVGANDGIVGDTIMPFAIKYGWRGVLVEPVPYIMARLQSNFGKLSQFSFEEAALDITPGRRKLYVVKESDKPRPAFAEVIHSFLPDVISGQKISWGFNPKKDIEAIMVRTTTFTELLKQYDILSPDLIVMDVEGYDYTLIKGMDFDIIRPAFLKFEHLNMTNSQEKEIVTSLEKAGYVVKKMRADYFCHLHD